MKRKIDWAEMGDRAKEILIRKRTLDEMKAYCDGFKAGVKMCQKAIESQAEMHLEAIELARGERYSSSEAKVDALEGLEPIQYVMCTALPSTGEGGKIYQVGGEDWAWNLGAWIKI